MRILRSSFCALVFSTLMHAQPPSTTLHALHDVARPLLIFGNPQDVRVQTQCNDLMTHAHEAKDREMQIALVASAPAAPRLGQELPQVQFSPQEQASLRKRFHIASGEFAVVLVGKDGGEKLRSHQVVPWSKLADTIDSMPMRQQEMRQH